MSTAAPVKFTTDGRAVPTALVGELADSSDLLSDPEALRASLKENGYLLLRRAIDPDTALAARHEVLACLAAVGEIDMPAETFSGHSRRPTGNPEAGEFLRDVCDGPRLRTATAHLSLRGIISTVFGEPARSHE